MLDAFILQLFGAYGSDVLVIVTGILGDSHWLLRHPNKENSEGIGENGSNGISTKNKGSCKYDRAC
jgi:hypothetical protein